MFSFLKDRRRAALRAEPLTPDERAIIDKNVPYASRLDDADRKELEGLVKIFLAEKSFEGCGGLEVTEEISDISGLAPVGSLGAQPFSKRTAQTQLVVKDQQTVVIGGLMRNQIARTDTKIPLLGDIPVLGALFRSSSTSLRKSNLILVLTPYIIREQADLRAVFERKMQERQEFLDHYFVFSDDTEYQPPKDYSRTNGLLEEIRESYMQLNEKRVLEELTRPMEVKTHDPSQPLELPAPSSGSPDDAPAVPPAAASPGSQAAPPPAAPAPPPNLNIAPPPRNLERMER